MTGILALSPDRKRVDLWTFHEVVSTDSAENRREIAGCGVSDWLGFSARNQMFNLAVLAVIKSSGSLALSHERFNVIANRIVV